MVNGNSFTVFIVSVCSYMLKLVTADFFLLDCETWLSLFTAHSLCFRYDEELGVVYMAARMAGCYAAVRRAMNEVKNKWWRS